MAILFTNNASTTLAVTLNPGDLTAILAGGTGALFPSPSGGDLFYLTIEDSGGNLEVCHCTGRSADTLTIVRGRDGTTAQTFTAGARVELRVTAGVMAELVQTATLAGINMTAGAGLTGGGDISASRSFALDTANNRNVDHSAVSVTAGNGLTGGGTLAATRTLTLGTPASLTKTTANGVTAESHTHAITSSVWDTATRSTSTTLAKGQVHAVSAGVTVQSGFAAGEWVGVYNSSASAITLTQGAGLTLRLAGTSATGNRTLAQRGLAVIWYNSTSEAVVSGSGVS
jgi:hypothetical protein